MVVQKTVLGIDYGLILYIHKLDTHPMISCVTLSDCYSNCFLAMLISKSFLDLFFELPRISCFKGEHFIDGEHFIGITELKKKKKLLAFK